VCFITGQLRTSLITAAQLFVGLRSAAADDQAGSVCESVLERAVLRATLDRVACGWRCRQAVSGAASPPMTSGCRQGMPRSFI